MAIRLVTGLEKSGVKRRLFQVPETEVLNKIVAPAKATNLHTLPYILFCYYIKR